MPHLPLREQIVSGMYVVFGIMFSFVILHCGFTYVCKCVSGVYPRCLYYPFGDKAVLVLLLFPTLIPLSEFGTICFFFMCLLSCNYF
jgi:hypothetical protein